MLCVVCAVCVYVVRVRVITFEFVLGVCVLVGAFGVLAVGVVFIQELRLCVAPCA